MSAQAMLTVTQELNIQPGEIPPCIHLKQASNSMAARLLIKAENATMGTGGTAVVKGRKPDDTDLFFVLPISDMDANYIYVDLGSNQFVEMTDAAGKYACTISIIDTEETVTRANYEEYDLVTVQPFNVEVQELAV